MTQKQPKRIPRAGIDEYGRSALHHAAINGDVDAINLLIKNGSDINQQDDNGYTALHFSALKYHHNIVVKLISLGSDVNLHDIYGNGPLWTAVMNSRGTLTIVTALLKANANPDHKNINNKSPREMANTIKNGIDLPFIDLA
jgi:uncharacterized protein